MALFDGLGFISQGRCIVKNSASKYLATILVSGFALVPSLNCAQAADAVSDADRSFVAMVSQGGMFEVKAGQVAADQGHTQDIKDQGSTEVHDHQLVGEKLKSVSSEAGISFDDKLNATFQKQVDDLKALTGYEFDRKYLRDMETIHDKDGAAFAKEAKSGTNPKLKAFAAETDRIVKRHIGELTALGPEK